MAYRIYFPIMFYFPVFVALVYYYNLLMRQKLHL